MKGSCWEATRWYRKAADQGHAGAQYRLGLCYESGKGAEKSRSEAARWLRMAADQGHAGASSELNKLNREGAVYSCSDAEVAESYRKEAGRGDAEAQYRLGLCYRYGDGVPQSAEEAARWFRMAADQGHPTATLKLEELERTRKAAGRAGQRAGREAVEPAGLGTRGPNRGGYELESAQKPVLGSIDACMRAAEEGDVDAMYRLGELYESGEGVDRSLEEALRWYSRAAELGHSKAQFKRGALYQRGYGIPSSKYRPPLAPGTRDVALGAAQTCRPSGGAYRHREGAFEGYGPVAQ
ncbi:MAG: sel1 repeat family protein [Candidatus Methanomethylophilaceae archaeon]|nr:sel1 repeat family protein [Candidatus Methanomethylophilaceae archaeon]